MSREPGGFLAARRSGCELRLAHHRAELRDDLERVGRAGEQLELAELRVEPRGFDRGALEPEDLRVPGRAHGLVVGPELLVQGLTGPRADELDLDVRLR